MGIGSWYLSDMGYAVRRGNFDGLKQTIRMHRLINRTPKGLCTDHINRNRLDNRKANLRTVTQAENMRNIERGLGVWFQKQNGNWVVELMNTHVGCFSDEGLALQVAHMIYEGDLPLTRMKEYSPYCRHGHNKEIVGTYNAGTVCRACASEGSKRYYRRKHGWKQQSLSLA